MAQPEMNSFCNKKVDNNGSLSIDSSVDIELAMADINNKIRVDGGQAINVTPSRPLSMKLFASWEVESNSASCVPRLFSVKLTRLQILKKMETNLNHVVISVSMQGSRRVLRSNEIALSSNGLIDTELDLSFSLQYPHFLKRSRNNVQIMIQRRKRYKARPILGFKTLALGLVNLSEILQCPVSAKRPLNMYTKEESTIVATVTMTNLTSQPVENDLDREIPQQTSDRVLEENSSYEEDEFYSSDGSDSANEIAPEVQDILNPDTKGRKVKFRPNQMKFKKKFIALLKKFRVTEEEVFGESSPREAEGAEDMMADDVIYPEDFDSDGESDIELGDTASIKSQDKPKLRPYFDRTASLDSMYVEKKTKPSNFKKVTRFDSEESTEAEHNTQEFASPHSDSEPHSDSPTTETPRKLKTGSHTKRSFSVKEVKNKNKVKLERRKSDLEIQDIPANSISEQLAMCFPCDNQLPSSILMINTAEWQGQLLALKLKDKQESRMICTSSDSDVQEVIDAILVKYQKFCHSHSISPPCLKIVVAATESYIGAILKPFVEQFSSKPMWQTYVRFLIVPLDCNHSVGKYISHIDSRYTSLFMDSVWRDVFEKPDSNADFETVNQRIKTYVNGASVTHHLPIAEALIKRGVNDDDSSKFIPFIGMVRIGCAGENEEIVNTNTTSPGSLQHVKESSSITSNNMTSPPSDLKVGNNTSREWSPPSGAVCNELMELQIDYWAAGGKKDSSKSTLKTAFKSLVVSRNSNIEEQGTLHMIATMKEHVRKVHAKSAFEAMMRGKKSKEKDLESTKGTIVANVTKLVCTSKCQNDFLNVVIDGVTWDDVKFFSLSPQWSRHVKTFPIGLIGPIESRF
ncbi:phosphofurin acidic cluster sorting protein 1-like isoform X2 [Xenia sp. Carnegie-2017]|uniref:phosphofurin acidic cluster sorting protein 1-like isoform X2 n=1 Tax=Xenia sp. Carnegie-2017 TaxID=2897299 RepID=UPI001F03DAC2|nr:phosphofurin acidic cluster sorting protein 1-like isoform X2 [Xenia sp. Carnegie-2017]